MNAECSRRHAIEIVNSTKKTNKRIVEIKMQNFAIFAKKNLRINILKRKSIAKLKSIVITQENIEVLHIAYVN